MKKIWMSATALVFAVNVAIAQNDVVTEPARATEPNQVRTQEGTPASQAAEADKIRADEYFSTLRRDLEINDDQMTRIRTLHTETVNSYNNMDARYLQNPEMYRERVNHILMVRDERLKTILSEDQYSRYNSNRAQYSTYDSRYFPSDIEMRQAETPGRVRAPADPSRDVVEPNQAPAPVDRTPAQPGQVTPPAQDKIIQHSPTPAPAQD